MNQIDKKRSKKNLLVTLADENYIEQAKQLFSSVYWNAGWKGDYMLLAHEIQEKQLKWFRKKGILIKKCRALCSLTKNPFVLVALTKFYLFTPELKKWKNIVYLDSDIIINASLKRLTNIQGFAAVHDLFPTIKDQFRENTNLPVYKEFSKIYDLKKKAFNSGVMAFNTQVIKKDSFSRLIDFSKNYLIINHPGEQAILNLLFYKKWERLPLAYNFNPFLMIHPFLTKKNPRIGGVIMHFPGERKPWNSKYSFYYKEWEKNLEKSDLMNIKKPVKNKRIYSELEIKEYSKYIKKKIFLNSPIDFLDKTIGLAGIYLKKKNPKIYYKLKSL